MQNEATTTTPTPESCGPITEATALAAAEAQARIYRVTYRNLEEELMTLATIIEAMREKAQRLAEARNKAYAEYAAGKAMVKRLQERDLANELAPESGTGPEPAHTPIKASEIINDLVTGKRHATDSQQTRQVLRVLLRFVASGNGAAELNEDTKLALDLCEDEQADEMAAGVTS